MNQDVDDPHVVNNECGNSFSRDRDEMIDATKIKVEDETDYFDAPRSSENHLTAFLDKPKECGKPFTKYVTENEEEMIDAT